MCLRTFRLEGLTSSSSLSADASPESTSGLCDRFTPFPSTDLDSLGEDGVAELAGERSLECSPAPRTEGVSLCLIRETVLSSLRLRSETPREPVENLVWVDGMLSSSSEDAGSRAIDMRLANPLLNSMLKTLDKRLDLSTVGSRVKQKQFKIGREPGRLEARPSGTNQRAAW